jgi:hypothetical protein
MILILGGLYFATGESFHAKAARLRPGMTKAEAFALMGEPDRLMKLGDVELALYTPVPFSLHALFTQPGQTLAGNANVMATEFPAYIEFRGEIATRVRVGGKEVEDVGRSVAPGH